MTHPLWEYQSALRDRRFSSHMGAPLSRACFRVYHHNDQDDCGHDAGNNQHSDHNADSPDHASACVTCVVVVSSTIHTSPWDLCWQLYYCSQGCVVHSTIVDIQRPLSCVGSWSMPPRSTRAKVADITVPHSASSVGESDDVSASRRTCAAATRLAPAAGRTRRACGIVLSRQLWDAKSVELARVPQPAGDTSNRPMNAMRSIAISRFTVAST